MIDEEAKAIGLRAVARPGWRWMRGSVTTDGDLFMRAFDAGGRTMAIVRWGGDPVRVVPIESIGPPDFRDPATFGCLLALVRTLHNDDSIWPQRITVDRWQMNCSRSVYVTGTTEIEVLVAALEATPAQVHHESENT